jgi:iron-sulfur cluster repair protein YtfE (RIC family)
MDDVDLLIREHAALRLLAAEIEKTIGPQREVGWDDRSDFKSAALQSASGRFHLELKAHEAKEDRVIARRSRGRDAGREELGSAIDKAHASLDEMDRLLSVMAGLYDGTHAHAVRTVAAELRRELEAHLEYEENVLFPLLR